MSLHITKLTDTSSKTNNNEEQLKEITSKFSSYGFRLDKLSTSNINKIDTEMKENEEKLNTEFYKTIDDIKAVTSSSINPTFPHPDSHNSNFLLAKLQLISLHGHFSSHHIFIHIIHSLPITYDK